MKLQENISGIELDENHSGIEKVIYFFAVSSSELLYSPSEDEEYNEKHRLECLICSVITHIMFVEIYRTDLFLRVKSYIINQVFSLIENSDRIDNFTAYDFIRILGDRYKFYGEEIENMSKLENNILPLKLLSLIYDEPLIDELQGGNHQLDNSYLEVKISQFIQFSTYFKSIKAPLHFAIENVEKLS